MKHSLIIIAAVAKNGVIGNRGQLPWDIPEDLEHFRLLTRGAPVIMGRITYESIIKKNGKPLPNRLNVVVTKQEYFLAQDSVVVVHSFEEALSYCYDNNVEKIFAIGGQEIYQCALKTADLAYITEVDAEPEGDAYFPHYEMFIYEEHKAEIINKNQKVSPPPKHDVIKENSKTWQLIEASHFALSSKSGISFRFLTFKRV